MKRKLVSICFICVVILTCTITGFTLSCNSYLNQLLNSVTCEKFVRINQLDKDIITYESNIIQSQITNYENQISQLNATISNPINGETPEELFEIQVDIIQYQIEIANLQYQLNCINYQTDIAEKTIQKQIDTNKFNIGLLYYNMCLFKEQKAMLNIKLEYLDKKLTVEQKKFEVGETAEYNVILIENELNSVRSQLFEINNSINVCDNQISTLAQDDTFTLDSRALDIDLLSIDTDDSLYTLEYLQTSFAENNFDILQQKNNVDNLAAMVLQLELLLGTNNDSFKLKQAEYEKAQLEVEMSIANYESKVFEKYNNYLSAKSSYNTISSSTSSTNKALTILNKSLEVGEISELEYLNQIYTLSNNQYNIKQAKVKLLQAFDELKLLEKGILVS